MGQKQSDSHLEFQQILEDHHFGKVQIYKSSDARLFMKKVYTFIHGEKKHKDFQQVLQFAKTIQHRSLIPMHQVQRQLSSNICIEYEKVTTYSQYYNHSLKDFYRKGNRAELNEIWLCFIIMVEIASLLKQKHLAFHCNLSNIFLSLRGVPSLYLHSIVTQEQYMNHSQLTLEQNIAFCILELCSNQYFQEDRSPEEQVAEFKQHTKTEQKEIIDFCDKLINLQITVDELCPLILEKQSNGEINIPAQIRITRSNYNIPPNSNIKTQSEKGNNTSTNKSTKMASTDKTEEKKQKSESIRIINLKHPRKKSCTSYQSCSVSSKMRTETDPFETEQKSRKFREIMELNKPIDLKNQIKSTFLNKNTSKNSENQKLLSQIQNKKLEYYKKLEQNQSKKNSFNQSLKKNINSISASMGKQNNSASVLKIKRKQAKINNKISKVLPFDPRDEPLDNWAKKAVDDHLKKKDRLNKR